MPLNTMENNRIRQFPTVFHWSHMTLIGFWFFAKALLLAICDRPTGVLNRKQGRKLGMALVSNPVWRGTRSWVVRQFSIRSFLSKAPSALIFLFTFWIKPKSKSRPEGQ
jgi:hypothetical protein